MRRAKKSSSQSRKKTVPKEMIHIWSLGKTPGEKNPHNTNICKTSSGPRCVQDRLDNSSSAERLDVGKVHRGSSKNRLIHPQNEDKSSSVAVCTHTSLEDTFQAVSPENQFLTRNGFASTDGLHSPLYLRTGVGAFSLAHPTEVMGIGMSQSVSNDALFSDDNQLHHFPDKEHYTLDSYARKPSASAFPAVRSVEEIYGRHDSGRVTNLPSTGRSYRYKVVYDHLVSDWYVCDCESATFERIGWVDTSEVLRLQ